MTFLNPAFGILLFMKIVIRLAKVEDAAAIALVHVKTWQCAYRGQIPDIYLDSLSIEKRTAGWKKQLKNPIQGASAFVAEVDGRVVGWCTFGKSRDKDALRQTGELHGIYIHPDYIGKGLGSRLMEKAIEILKEQGYKKATLWVLTTNEKSRKWYEKKNWQIEGKNQTVDRGDFKLHETRYVYDL